MRRSIILNLINKLITEKIYRQARKQEEKLDPDNFVAHYSIGSIIYWLFCFLLSVLLMLCFSFFDNFVLYMAGVASIGCFFIVLYYVSYRCFVDDMGITKIVFWLFRKQIFWKDVKKVDIQEYERCNKPLEKDAILRNKQNKIIYTCSYDLVGFNLIVKKAKNNARKN